MALQLGGGGYRPAQTDVLASQQASDTAQANKLTQSMQNKKFAWEVQDRQDKHKNSKAQSGMYEYFMNRRTAYDPDKLAENMVTNPEDYGNIQEIRGFSDESKMKAFNTYKSVSAQPDTEWFEKNWAALKAEEDGKIANELLNDYNTGKITEEQFNIAARDRSFQDFYRKSKLDVDVQTKLDELYDPKYRTWREAVFGGPVTQNKGLIERNPITSATLLGGGVGGAEMTRRSLKLGKEITQAENLVKQASGVVDKYSDIDAWKAKDPWTIGKVRGDKPFQAWLKAKNLTSATKDNYTTYQGEVFDDLVKKANKGQKAAKETLKALEDRRLIKRVGKQWVKLPGYAKSIGMIGGMLAIKPIVKGITGSEKAGEVAGLTAGVGIGGKMWWDATRKTVRRNIAKKLEGAGKKGYKNVADNMSKIIAKRGWPWVLKRVGKEAPWLLTKVLGKTAIGAVGSPFTAGGMAALMGMWTAYDLVQIYGLLKTEGA